MQVYDIFMLVVLITATIWGLWKGLAWQLASLGSIVLSYVVAVQFRGPVSKYIEATPPWNVFLAMLILYLATSVLVWLGFRMVHTFIDRVKLKEFDHQIGAVLGAAKGVVLCVIITLFAVALLSETQRSLVIDSRSGHYIAILLDKSHDIMPKELHDILHPHHERLETAIGNGSAHEGHRHDGHDHSPATHAWGNLLNIAGSEE